MIGHSRTLGITTAVLMVVLGAAAPLFAQNWPAWSNPALPQADTSTGQVDHWRATLRLQYSALDGSHPADDPVPNRHIVELKWWRVELGVAYAFAEDWSMELSIPYDVKNNKVRYELPDGTPFDNPVGKLHHRTETLDGFADAKLLAYRHFRPDIFQGIDNLSLGFGLTIPVGRTEENPYELAAEGNKHQHIQFGNGTFDPLFRFAYSVEPNWWGVDVLGGVQAPLYENNKGYRGSLTVDAAAGVKGKLYDWVSAFLRYNLLYQDRAHWDGESDPNSGFLVQTVSLSLPLQCLPSLKIAPSAQYAFFTRTLGGDDAFALDWLLSLSIAWDFGAPDGE